MDLSAGYKLNGIKRQQQRQKTNKQTKKTTNKKKILFKSNDPITSEETNIELFLGKGLSKFIQIKALRKRLFYYLRLIIMALLDVEKSTALFTKRMVRKLFSSNFPQSLKKVKQ